MIINKLLRVSRQYIENHRQAYRREMFHQKIQKHRLSLLVGQRGVGKTTIMVQALLDHAGQDSMSSEILYVPSDHFLLGGLALYEIAEAFIQLGGRVIAFDEIHQYPGWSKELKSLYDTFPELIIMTSGSSALEIHRGSHDLTRRAIVHEVPGLSFREYLELHVGVSLKQYTLPELLANHSKIASDVIDTLAKKNKKVLAEFKRYLAIGYYPYFLELQDVSLYYATLEQNFHASIDSDLTAVYPSLTGASVRKIKQLLSFIASAVPFSPNYNKIKEALEVGDARTLKTYLKYLEDVGLIHQVMKETNKLNRIETPEKIYLGNPNQLYAITASSQNMGTVRELFFLNMLLFEHEVTFPVQGDFQVDHQYVFEVGGKKKGFEQVKQVQNAYLACDDIEFGDSHKLPLWLFGFLY